MLGGETTVSVDVEQLHRGERWNPVIASMDLMKKPISVMIVEDHAVVRAGLRMLIEQDRSMTVVAMTGNINESIERAASQKPDIIILDSSSWQ